MNKLLIIFGIVWFLLALLTAVMIIYGYRLRKVSGKAGFVLIFISYLSGVLMLGYAISTI
jgi:hypothetical protein